MSDLSDYPDVVREAFGLAMRDIAASHPNEVDDPQVKEKVLLRILDLFWAGQKSPTKLASYAVVNRHVER